MFHTAARPLTIWHTGAWGMMGAWHVASKQTWCTWSETACFYKHAQTVWSYNTHAHACRCDCVKSFSSYMAAFSVVWDQKWTSLSGFPAFPNWLNLSLPPSLPVPIFSYVFYHHTHVQTHTHTHSHDEHHHPLSCQAEEAERRGAWPSGSWCFLFSKGLTGPWVCMADRLDLIPGLIQSLCPLRPAWPGSVHHGTAQMPLCIPLAAKYMRGTILKVVVLGWRMFIWKEEDSAGGCII